MSKGTIYYGLAAIKGLSKKAATEIVHERRKRGPFKDLEDFVRRVLASPVTEVNKGHVEALILAGAFDDLGDRAEMVWQLGYWAKWASKMRAYTKYQNGITTGNIRKSYPPEPDFDDLDTVCPAPMKFDEKLREEMRLMGQFVSGHPMQGYEPLEGLVEKLTNAKVGSGIFTASEPHPTYGPRRLRPLLGYVKDVGYGKIKNGFNKGKEYAKIQFLMLLDEDLEENTDRDRKEGLIYDDVDVLAIEHKHRVRAEKTWEIMAWPDELKAFYHHLQPGKRLLIIAKAKSGSVPPEQDSHSVELAIPLDELISDWTRLVHVDVEDESALRELAEALKDMPPETCVLQDLWKFCGPTVRT